MVSPSTSSSASTPLLAGMGDSSGSDCDGDDKVGAVRARALKKQSSTIFWPITFTAIVLGGIAALLILNPIGWKLTAIIAGSVGLAMLIANYVNYKHRGKFHKQQMDFELSTLWRMLPGDNYSAVNLKGLKRRDSSPIPHGAVLYVGGLPNKKRPGNSIPPGVKAVLSNNEAWELQPIGPSDPLTEADWKNLGATNKPNLSLDHAAVPIEQMTEAADYLYPPFAQGEPVLSHCRAGCGRSATSAAAMMMRDLRDSNGQRLTIEEVCVRIKDGRAKSTIWNKLHALVAFEDHLRPGRADNDHGPSHELVYKWAAILKAQEERGKKPELPKDIRKQLTKIAHDKIAGREAAQAH